MNTIGTGGIRHIRRIPARRRLSAADAGTDIRIRLTGAGPGSVREQDGSPSDLLLLVDGDPVSGSRLEHAMRRRKFEVRSAGSIEEAASVLAYSVPSCAVVDYMLPDGPGAKLIPELLAYNPSMTIVVLSLYATFQGAVQAVKAGAIEFLTRPACPDEINAVLRRWPSARRLPSSGLSSSAEVLREHAEVMMRREGADAGRVADILRVDPRTLRRLLADRDVAPLACAG